jgi:hypothetical protein
MRCSSASGWPTPVIGEPRSTLGEMVPYLSELSPTNIGQWAQAVVVGDPAPLSLPLSWLVSMVVIVVGAKIVFDRQEF